MATTVKVLRYVVGALFALVALALVCLMTMATLSIVGIVLLPVLFFPAFGAGIMAMVCFGYDVDEAKARLDVRRRLRRTAQH